MRFISSVAVTVAGVARADLGVPQPHEQVTCSVRGNGYEIEASKDDKCKFPLCNLSQSIAMIEFGQGQEPMVAKISEGLNKALAYTLKQTTCGMMTEPDIQQMQHDVKGLAGTVNEVTDDKLSRWLIAVTDVVEAQERELLCKTHDSTGMEVTFERGSCGFDVCFAHRELNDMGYYTYSNHRDEVFNSLSDNLASATQLVADGHSCGSADEVRSVIINGIGNIYGGEVPSERLLQWKAVSDNLLSAIKKTDTKASLIKKFKLAYAKAEQNNPQPKSSGFSSIFGGAKPAVSPALSLVRELHEIGNEVIAETCTTGSGENFECGVRFCKLAVETATGAIEHVQTGKGDAYADILRIMARVAHTFNGQCPMNDKLDFLGEVSNQMRSVKEAQGNNPRFSLNALQSAAASLQ